MLFPNHIQREQSGIQKKTVMIFNEENHRKDLTTKENGAVVNIHEEGFKYLKKVMVFPLKTGGSVTREE